jgi:hypothetical protein
MTNPRTLVAGLILLVSATLTGCQEAADDAGEQPGPSTDSVVGVPDEGGTVDPTYEVVAEAEGFAVPECVLPAGDGTVFISNIDAGEDQYWDDDGAGYISRADAATLEVTEERWADGLNAPKGMCILDDHLWVSDNTRIVAILLEDPTQRQVLEPEGAEEINDLVAHEGIVYASDTAAAVIHRVEDGELLDPIAAPDTVNGITFGDSQMWAVSWDQHDIYRMDPTGASEPEPLGVAEHFTNLDAIEELADGRLLVSDFFGNKVCIVDPADLAVETVAEIESPADLGLDEDSEIIYVPQFLVDRVVALPLG